MARTNKYTSINFNDVYEKKLNATSSSAATNSSSPVAGKYPFSPSIPHKSYSFSASSRSHGMLVLSRTSPKPISQPQPQPYTESKSRNLPSISPTTQTPAPLTDQESRIESDSISLRPLGKTGSGPLISSPPSLFPCLEEGEKEAVTMTVTRKSDKFVPPHLRPGFVAKKEDRQAPVAAAGRGREVGGFRPGSAGPAGGFGSSPTRYGEDRRPQSGGGYERVIGTRGFLDPSEMNRPRSSGTQRSSSG